MVEKVKVEVKAQQPAVDKKQNRQQEAERRKQLQPYRDKVSQWEKKVSELQKQNAELEVQLADTSLYKGENKMRLTELLSYQAKLKFSLAEAETKWLSSAEDLESAELEP